MGLFDFYKKRKSCEGKELNPVPESESIEAKRPIYTPENIRSLAPDEIFVFGSNLSGAHAGGAARTAWKKFGAIWGQGVGKQGQSYAIPTMQGGVETIKPYVDEFICYAKAHPELFFYVTRIGCGIAGFRDEEIAVLFKKSMTLNNVCLPESFVLVLNTQSANEVEEIEESTVIELSKAILDTISVYDIIYAELSEGGAMGCVGQIMFYIIRNEQLIRYKTNLYEDENLYVQAGEMLLAHQNAIGDKNAQTDEILFNYYYGGMGNHVLVNKNISLEITESHFIYNKCNRRYHIYASVFGVFNNASRAMQKSLEKGHTINKDTHSPDKSK
jgi:hypothetical protein